VPKDQRASLIGPSHEKTIPACAFCLYPLSWGFLQGASKQTAGKDRLFFLQLINNHPSYQITHDHATFAIDSNTAIKARRLYKLFIILTEMYFFLKITTEMNLVIISCG
jgi:hypothetical protein